MATPLTDSINALTTYANSVTGESDTTLSDAVYTLAQGYGGGSFSIEIQEVTITEDFEGSAVALAEHLTETYDWWDGTKWFMVLEHQWKSIVYPSIAKRLVYLHGFATGWGGTRSMVANDATTNNNISANQITDTGTYRLVAGDKYLVVG